MANHTVILLDAPTLVEEDNKRILQGQSFETWSPVVGGPVEFVKATARGGFMSVSFYVFSIPE